MEKDKIITDIIYQWCNEERTEIDVIVCYGCKEYSVAQIDISELPYEERFNDDCEDDDTIYNIAHDIAYEMGYILEGEIEKGNK